MGLTQTELDYCFKDLRQFADHAEEFYNLLSDLERGVNDYGKITGVELQNGKVIRFSDETQKFFGCAQLSKSLDGVLNSSGKAFKRGFIRAYIVGRGYGEHLVEIYEQLTKHIGSRGLVTNKYGIEHGIEEGTDLNWKQWYETEEIIIQSALNYIDRWIMYNELFSRENQPP